MSLATMPSAEFTIIPTVAKPPFAIYRERRYIPFLVVGFVILAAIAAYNEQPMVCDMCIAEIFFIGSLALVEKPKAKVVIDEKTEEEVEISEEAEEAATVTVDGEVSVEKRAEVSPIDTNVPAVVKPKDGNSSDNEGTLDSPPPPYEEPLAQASIAQEMVAIVPTPEPTTQQSRSVEREDDGYDSEKNIDDIIVEISQDATLIEPAAEVEEATLIPSSSDTNAISTLPVFTPTIPERREYISSRPVTPIIVVAPTPEPVTVVEIEKDEKDEAVPNPVPERVEYINRQPHRVSIAPPTPPISPPRESFAVPVAVSMRSPPPPPISVSAILTPPLSPQMMPEYFSGIDEIANKDADVSAIKIEDDWQDFGTQSMATIADSPVESVAPRWNASLPENAEEQDRLRDQLREAFDESFAASVPLPDSVDDDLPEVMHVEDVAEEVVVKEEPPVEVAPLKFTKSTEASEASPAAVASSSATLSPGAPKPALIIVTQEEEKSSIKVLYDAANSRKSSFNVHDAIPPVETEDHSFNAADIISRMDAAIEETEIAFTNPFASDKASNEATKVEEPQVKSIAPLEPVAVSPVTESKPSPPRVIVTLSEEKTVVPAVVISEASEVPEPSSPASTVSTMVEDKDATMVKVVSQAPTIIEEEEMPKGSISQTPTINEESEGEDHFEECATSRSNINKAPSSRASSTFSASQQDLNAASSSIDYTGTAPPQLHRSPSGSAIRIKTWLRKRISVKGKRTPGQA